MKRTESPVGLSVSRFRVSVLMTPGTPILDPPFSRNFRRLVLGCIVSYDSVQWLILQGFSRSTRFAFLCTAQISKFQQKFIKLFDIFTEFFCKICKILIKIIIFRTDFCEILSEFHEIPTKGNQKFVQQGTGIRINLKDG